MYFDFPDVVFSKGGSESFPPVLAARILGIPIIIHESDAAPGKANVWAGKFAKRIAVSFPGSAEYFSKGKVAVVGNPIRKEFFIREVLGAKEYFKLENGTPVVFVFGGSQGSRNINDNLLDILPELLPDYQIIHQCGKNNYDECQGRADLILEKSPFKSRYRPFPFLSFDEMRMAYGAADLVVSRAGSGSIFEIAASGLPSIIIPLDRFRPGTSKGKRLRLRQKRSGGGDRGTQSQASYTKIGNQPSYFQQRRNEEFGRSGQAIRQTGCGRKKSPEKLSD